MVRVFWALFYHIGPFSIATAFAHVFGAEQLDVSAGYVLQYIAKVFVVATNMAVNIISVWILMGR